MIKFLTLSNILDSRQSGTTSINEWTVSSAMLQEANVAHLFLTWLCLFSYGYHISIKSFTALRSSFLNKCNIMQNHEDKTITSFMNWILKGFPKMCESTTSTTSQSLTTSVLHSTDNIITELTTSQILTTLLLQSTDKPITGQWHVIFLLCIWDKDEVLLLKINKNDLFYNTEEKSNDISLLHGRSLLKKIIASTVKFFLTKIVVMLYT